MIVPDANLLLYAYHPRAKAHADSHRWLESVLSGHETVGLTWLAIWAFLRIGTNRRVFEEPMSVDEATKAVTSWLDRPQVTIIEPRARHWTILQTLLEEAQCVGPLVTDATLAALVIEHGGTLYTTDRDFSRFPELSWKNPLELP